MKHKLTRFSPSITNFKCIFTDWQMYPRTPGWEPLI